MRKFELMAKKLCRDIVLSVPMDTQPWRKIERVMKELDAHAGISSTFISLRQKRAKVELQAREWGRS